MHANTIIAVIIYAITFTVDVWQCDDEINSVKDCILPNHFGCII
jgi:hypothetical protein